MLQKIKFWYSNEDYEWLRINPDTKHLIEYYDDGTWHTRYIGKGLGTFRDLYVVDGELILKTDKAVYISGDGGKSWEWECDSNTGYMLSLRDYLEYNHYFVPEGYKCELEESSVVVTFEKAPLAIDIQWNTGRDNKQVGILLRPLNNTDEEFAKSATDRLKKKGYEWDNDKHRGCKYIDMADDDLDDRVQSEVIIALVIIANSYEI